MRIIKSLTERFWDKVDIRNRDECWPWLGSHHGKGYGHFRVGGKIIKAHRFAYEDLVGEIPQGLVIDHKCRNKNCVNPSHLEPVTNWENILRGNGVNGRNYKKPEKCQRGHLYSETQFYRKDGRTECRECARIARRTREVKILTKAS